MLSGARELDELSKLIEPYARVPVDGLARDLLRKITLYHRVQGSSGIREAVMLVREILEKTGLEIRLFEIPVDTVKGFMETPVSWDLENGIVEFKTGNDKISRLSAQDRPTLVSAHSPPSEGCAELTICNDLRDCKGEAVLVEAPGYIAYKELDSRLIVLYDSKRHPDGVPYTGLFISSSEIKEKSVVNINYTLASRLIHLNRKGFKIEVCWKIETRFTSKPMYGLLAHSGDDPGVLYMSHICHPKPGAHDNASGVVANMLSAILAQTSDIKFPHAHLFIPEYTGTIFTEDKLPWRPIGVINLDMVGAKQWITNSTLNIVNAPVFMKSYSTSATLLATKVVLDEVSSFGGFKLPGSRYSITPYTAGSDHDVTIIRGLDSTMLNEWPSKYYHTDLDDIETISIQGLSKTALISVLAGNILVSKNMEQLLRLFRDYLKSWYSLEAYRYSKDISRLSKVIDNQVELDYHEKLTPVSMRILYRELGLDKYEKLRNIKGAHSFLTVYAPLAYVNNISDYFETFQLENLIEWSIEDRKLIDEAWERIKAKLR